MADRETESIFDFDSGRTTEYETATRYLPARYEGLRYTIRNDGEPVARGNLEVTD